MRFRQPVVAALLALVLALNGALVPRSASSQVREGATLTVLRGQVAVIRPDGSATQPAPSGTVVNAGDEIRTISRTGALITFFAGTEIEMGEDTILVVERVIQQGSRVDVSLKQVFGVTVNRVQSLTDPASSYRIEAGGATAVVRGTTFALIGPVTTSQGNIVALVCLEDCTPQTTFAGCPVSAYTGFGVTVEAGRVTSGCETFAVGRDADLWNAAFEAVTTFEQAFAGSSGERNPGGANLGRERGTVRSEQREREQNEEDDDKKNNQPGVGAAPVVGPSCAPVGFTPTPTQPGFRAGFGSVVEGNGGTTTLNIPVFLFPAQTTPASVQYATADLTATAGADYQPTSGTLTFAPGQTTQNVQVQVIGDAAVEPSELLRLVLSNATGAPIVSSQGLGQIVDDDGPPTLLIDSVSDPEGNAGLTPFVFDVTLSRPSTQTVTVDYATTAGTATAGADFQPTAGTLTFTPGQTTQQITVNVVGDTTPEPSETFFVTLSNPTNATLLFGQGTGTIVDDDGPPTLSIDDDSVLEGCDGTTTLIFFVELTPASTSPVTVQFATADGTAASGQDYDPTSGTLTFQPGETFKEIRVTVRGDATPEPDETVFVNLSGPSSGVQIGDGQGQGTIVNDD